MTKKDQVALITGAARRVGQAIATHFHEKGYKVVIHFRHSRDNAERLVRELNAKRANSAASVSADLDQPKDYKPLIEETIKLWGRLDILINNASTFYPTPVEQATLEDWDKLMHSNLKAPFFLAQAAAPHLRETGGNIINITDIHAKAPMKNYPIYSAAKAGLMMLTQSLALELAPTIRVNAVAPGCVIWAEGQNVISETAQKALLDKTLLQRQVTPTEIAEAALFLANHAGITGQMISVDGGRIGFGA